MDQHVMHNIIHQDAGNRSEKCSVCNGTVKMSDKSALEKETNEVLHRKQVMNSPYAYSAEANTYSGKDDIDKSKIHSFSEIIEFGDSGDLPKKIQVLKSGTYNTQKYGKITLTKADLQEMVKNFNDGVRAGTALPIDIDHDKGEAAGWMKSFSVDSKGILWADVEWTPLGEQKLTGKQYGFVSAEFHQYYVDPEHSIELNNVITAASLVNRPMLKELQPLVKFSEEEDKEDVNKNLTDDKKDVMLFIDQPTGEQINQMNLKDILNKPVADRNADEAKFLSEHKEELTPEEKIKEGFEKSPTTKEKDEDKDKKTPVTASEDPNGGRVITASEWDEMQALKGRVEFSELKETVTAYQFSGEGDKATGKIPGTMVDDVAKFMQKLSPTMRVEFEETILKKLPDAAKLFTEEGGEEEPTGDTATATILSEVNKMKAEGTVKTFSEGLEIIRTTKVDLYKQYAGEQRGRS